MYMNTNSVSQHSEESLRGSAEGKERKPQWDIYKEMSSPYTHAHTKAKW